MRGDSALYFLFTWQLAAGNPKLEIDNPGTSHDGKCRVRSGNTYAVFQWSGGQDAVLLNEGGRKVEEEGPMLKEAITLTELRCDGRAIFVIFGLMSVPGVSLEVKLGEDSTCHVDAKKGRKASFRWLPDEAQPRLKEYNSRAIEVTSLSCGESGIKNNEEVSEALKGMIPTVQAVARAATNDLSALQSGSGMCSLSVRIMAASLNKGDILNKDFIKALCSKVDPAVPPPSPPSGSDSPGFKHLKRRLSSVFGKK
ncbi:hypothetical protein FOL47_006751 [Perkinsus chesapeaki]|uniref:Uncharacterized protein n=1 Tax=Perkinsus chesapeaki TaxID=330153 RepID=A0A7J6LPR9_PERCH|nr:hypothetical protein FOL47_006751 [Perkinsus chesapeaki]